ncbi:MAG: indolepyruvate oxidoreductase subunit beta [Thermoplasmata archaeon]|nr:MAG: indolepyruvate oxidoreductase subunit beta [Thermoplasmata archaeon]
MDEESCTNLVVVGVGGQGIILVSRIIGEAALKSGLNVMVSEIHGMAQRGGMVVSTIRIGDVHSPMIGKGDAHMILGFEPVETYRHLKMASKKTTIITSVNPIYPPAVSSEDDTYPDLDLLLKNLDVGKRLVKLDAENLAISAKLPVIVTNIILLGALSGACKELPVSADKLKETISKNVPKRFIDENIGAFDLGFKEARRNSS